MTTVVDVPKRDVTRVANDIGLLDHPRIPSGSTVRFNGGRSFELYPLPGTSGWNGDPVPFQNDDLYAELERRGLIGEPEEPRQPRPASADPAPPELIPDTEEAIAVCLSPDVCRAPQAPTPFMVYGRADMDRNYSPDVRSNGLVIKRADSVFTTTLGDEPGIGLGVRSGTVGSIVQPVTSSSAVFANGIPVQRHADRCTLNNGNCPGEYVHVRNDAAVAAPDATDDQERTTTDVARAQAGQAIDGFYENSPEAQAAVAAWNRLGDYVGDPNLVGEDFGRLRDSVPTSEEVVQFGRDAARGARDVGQYVIDNPGQSARNVFDWGVEGLKGLWQGTEDAYQEGGIARAGGHVAAAVASAVNPFRKARAAGEGVDALGDAGRAGRRDRRDGDGGGEAAGGERQGETAGSADGTRSSRRTFWSAKNFAGRRVYQRDDLIDPDKRGPDGRTNAERMATGDPPIGPDNRPVNLHHMIQDEPGPIAEVAQGFHKSNHRILHFYPNGQAKIGYGSAPPPIDRGAFRTWSRQYWKERSKDFR